MSSQRSIHYDNSIRTRYSLDIIAKVLKTESAAGTNVNGYPDFEINSL